MKVRPKLLAELVERVGAQAVAARAGNQEVHADEPRGAQQREMVVNRRLRQTRETGNLGLRARPLGKETEDAQAAVVAQRVREAYQAGGRNIRGRGEDLGRVQDHDAALLSRVGVVWPLMVLRHQRDPAQVRRGLDQDTVGDLFDQATRRRRPDARAETARALLEAVDNGRVYVGEVGVIPAAQHLDKAIAPHGEVARQLRARLGQAMNHRLVGRAGSQVIEPVEKASHIAFAGTDANKQEEQVAVLFEACGETLARDACGEIGGQAVAHLTHPAGAEVEQAVQSERDIP